MHVDLRSASRVVRHFRHDAHSILDLGKDLIDRIEVGYQPGRIAEPRFCMLGNGINLMPRRQLSSVFVRLRRYFSRDDQPRYDLLVFQLFISPCVAARAGKLLKIRPPRV